MGWKNKRGEVLIASSDIPVFKIGCINSYTNRVEPYFHHESGLVYWEGRSYNRVRPFVFSQGSSSYPFIVAEAFHSYSVKNIRLTTDECPNSLFRVFTYKTSPDAYDVYSRDSQVYTYDDIAIMLCVIPKGVRYAINSVGEVVSDSIRFIKIIKNPLSLNKDGSISKRSLSSINSVLNDWECKGYKDC